MVTRKASATMAPGLSITHYLEEQLGQTEQDKEKDAKDASPYAAIAHWTGLPNPAVVVLLAVGFADSVSRRLRVYPPMEAVVASAQLAILFVCARVGALALLSAIRRGSRLSAYHALLDGLRPAAVACLAGAMGLLLGVHSLSDEWCRLCFERVEWLITAVGLLSAGKWLLEAFYSTKLLKLRCGEGVSRNAWKRAVLKRLEGLDPESPLPAEPSAILDGTSSSPWKFELQCAELMRYHIKGAGAAVVDEQDVERESAIVAHTIVKNLDSLRRLKEQAQDHAPEDATNTSPELRLSDLTKVLSRADAEEAWAWFLSSREDAWLLDHEHDPVPVGLFYRGDKEPGLGENVMAKSVFDMHAEATELVSNIRQYNTIFGLFRSAVRWCYVVLVAALILAILFPSSFERLCWTLSSLVVACSFIFGSFLCEVCESLLLILMIHPFDAGDRVVLFGQRYLIVELHVLSTTCLNSNKEVVHLRNSNILKEQSGCVNLSRSEFTECSVEIEIQAEDVMVSNLQRLEHAARQWCSSRPEVWVHELCGAATVNSGGSTGMRCAASAGQVPVSFRAVHRRNLQDPYEVKVDTSQLLFFLVEECNKNGIRLWNPPR